MSNLSASELIKRPWRTAVIIKKIKEKTPFETSKGVKAVLTLPKDILSKFEAATTASNAVFLNAMRFQDVKDPKKLFKLTELVKTSEFGGKGEGSGTFKEDKELASLNRQIDDIKMATGKPTVPIKIQNTVYNIYTAVSTPGTPKSDFHLVDMNGKEVVWISHKDGKLPKDFQQWGGISLRKEPLINKHPETEAFVKDLKAAYPNGLPTATTLYRKIKDNKLKMLSVYGNAYGGGQLGQQNVSMLLQGPVKLIKSNQSYTLSANHVHYNGDSVDADGFEPVFMAIYKGDRSDAGIRGTRIGISPIASRKGKEFA